jgi:serine/threonine-protein kinase
MTLSSGRRLGPYEIVSLLGSGGMGEVYRARDARLNRDVAIKLLPAAFTEDPDRLHRFELEARAAGAVNHPNVLAIYDVGTAEGVPYVVSELLDGETLRQALRDGKPPMHKAAEWAVAIARGLAAAHDKGVVHRDLKPENLIVTSDGRVKIIDFGLAKLTQAVPAAGLERVTVTDATVPGTVLGTVGYMSPEQVRGEHADQRSDVFSFGAVLYEMLSGRRAFEGDNASETMAAILRDDPPAFSRTGSAVSPGLDRVVRRCLEKRPGERFQSAHELGLALEAARPRAILSGPTELRLAESRPRRRRALGAAVALLAVAVAAGAAWMARARWSTVSGPRALPLIAVLPLENISRDPAQDYFADGMTEALITDLAKVGGLRVIARTSVLQYKGTDRPAAEIARQLGVMAVLEGSVQQAGDRVRITARLIDARTDEHLWAESYDRDLKDVLTLQSGVARATARAIRVTLTPADDAQLAAAQPIDPDAYRLYLHARHLLNGRSTEGIKEAIGELQQVISREPDHALAYAALSEAYSILDDLGGLTPEDAHPKAIEAARRALHLDPSLAEAHASLGHILLHRRQWDAAKRELRQAMELNPSLATARRWYANALGWSTGDVEGALREAREAHELDPSSPVSGVALGSWLLYARRYDEAILQVRGTSEMDPRAARPHYWLGWIYSLQGRHEEAIAAAYRFQELSPDRSSRMLLTYVYARAGRRDEARALLSELRAEAPASEPLPENLAHIYVALGDAQRALAVLEKGFREDPGELVGIGLSPDMDALGNDPRFQRIVKELRAGSPSEGTSR